MSVSSDGYPNIILSGTDLDLPPSFTNSFAKYTDFKPMAKGAKTSLESCWDNAMGRTVAIKRLLPEYAEDVRERRRFLREVRVTAQLQHPATVPVYELGLDNTGALYFTMKKIAGQDLFRILQRLSWGDSTTSREYPLDMLLSIIIKASQALAYAHVHGVVHRDVKPENIWVGRFGEVILLDWGVSKVWGASKLWGSEPDEPSVENLPPPVVRTGCVSAMEAAYLDAASESTPDGAPDAASNRTGGETPDTSAGNRRYAGSSAVTDGHDEELQSLTITGQRPGTPLYMSPEQVLGHKSIDERTDIFSMGVVMYEMLTFREPFRGRTVHETFDNIIHETPPLPREAAPSRNIPAVLEGIVMKAIQKEAGNRYQSMLDLIDAIRDARNDILRST